MMQRSRDFWSRIRTVNWILGGIGMAWAGFHALPGGPAQVRYAIPGATSSGLAAGPPSAASRTEKIYPGQTVNYVAFSGDGRTVVGSGSEITSEQNTGVLHGWDAATGRQLWRRSFPGPVEQGAVRSVLMPDRSTLVTLIASRERTASAASDGPGGPASSPTALGLNFYEARSGALRFSTGLTSLGTEHIPVSIDVAPDGRSVAVACEKRILIWRSGDGKKFRLREMLDTPSDRRLLPVSRAKFTADGRNLVVLSQGYSNDMRRIPVIDIWNAESGARVRSFGERVPITYGGAFQNEAVMAALAPDRRRVVTFSDRDREFTLWDVNTGKRLRSAHLDGPRAVVTSWGLRFGPSRSRIREHAWDKVTVQTMEAEPGTTAPSSGAALHWNLTTNASWRTLQRVTGEPAQQDAVSPDGGTIATTGPWRDRRLVRLWEARSGREVRALVVGGAM